MLCNNIFFARFVSSQIRGDRSQQYLLHKWRHVLFVMTSSIIPLLWILNIWRRGGVGWQPCGSHRRGSKHKELAALVAERSVPITQFMSSKATSLSSSDKPGPLMSCGLHSSPSVRDAGAETPSSFASLKEKVEKQSKTSQLVAQPKSHQSSSKRKLEEASKIDCEID